MVRDAPYLNHVLLDGVVDARLRQLHLAVVEAEPDLRVLLVAQLPQLHDLLVRERAWNACRGIDLCSREDGWGG